VCFVVVRLSEGGCWTTRQAPALAERINLSDGFIRRFRGLTAFTSFHEQPHISRQLVFYNIMPDGNKDATSTAPVVPSGGQSGGFQQFDATEIASPLDEDPNVPTANAAMEFPKEEGQEAKPKKPPTRVQVTFAWACIDVLVYVTIINLFVEYIESMELDSFTISILTSIVLKLVLEGVHYLQHKFKHYFCDVRGAEQRYWKLVGAFFIWLVLFGSKFVILWIDETIFPDKVDLGGVKLILVLSLALMIAEKVLRLLWWQLGKDRPAQSSSCRCSIQEVAQVIA
jgi:hypothetical protein